MAHIRTYTTNRTCKGKPVRAYRVVWREPARDEFGVALPGQQRACQETYHTREAAEARRDELNAAKHVGGTNALVQGKVAGEKPFGHYARLWLDALQVRVADGKLKQSTRDEYERLLRCYVLDDFGPRAIASITSADCEQFRARLVTQSSRQGDRKPLTPGTRKHAWDVLRRVLAYAMKTHGAIPSNPADATHSPGARGTGDHGAFEHYPLTAKQVGLLSAAIAGDVDGLPAYPVYGLMVEFMAYTGLRASEVAGQEVGDLVFTPGPKCSVKVQQTKDRKGGQWVTGTPKSKKSRRTVPLPPWLATKLADYLANTHPHGDRTSADYDASAPLWPSRKNGGGYRAQGQRYAVPLDWCQPLAMGTFYDTILKPALEAVGLPASRPATANAPAARGVRLHDLRHTFAVLQLSAGTHFMQVSKWLGHSTFTLTLDTYGDYVPEQDGGAANTLPEPPAPVRPAAATGNVVPLRRRG
jgi:integrase